MNRDTSRPDLEAIARSAEGAGRPLPPVHLWNPARSGEIDIVIRPDGRWYHEGGLIGREALVRLFSTILRRDDDGFWLVTPVEKLRIVVEDAPFVAVRVDRTPRGDLRFTTNVGDEVIAGPGHALRVETDPVTKEPRPYVHVRRGLEALIARPVFYELAELAESGRTPEGEGLYVTSGGERYLIGELEGA